MSDQEEVRGPRYPQGRFMRLWMECEVEVVDEMALRTFDLHPTGDGQGNMTGLVEMEKSERVGHAVGHVFTEAMRAREAETGVRWFSGGPAVRWLDDDDHYAEATLPRMPQRGDDGQYHDEWPPPGPPPGE